MAEADDGQRKRCTCGFWGSPNTMNMCSQCYKEHQKNTQNSTNTNNKTSNPTATLLSGLLAGFPTVSNKNNIQQQEQQEQGIIDNCTKPVMYNNDECENEGTDSLLPIDLPIQKNKRRCWTCRQKMELAQRELGLCKCGYIFCLIHRLPEQHNCVFNHKVSGRQEAMKNMVETGRKKIGRSFHRMDSKPDN